MNNNPKLRFKDKNGNAYPEWEEKKIGDICKINMGQSPDSSSYNDNKDGIPLIQGNADILNRVTFPKRYTNKPTKICEIGSLIMTVRAPVGYIAKSYHKACIGRGVCELIPKESTDFLFQFMQKIEDSWKKIEQGSTFSAVNRNDIENLRINIPCLNEQEKIAGFLSKVDELINECEGEVKDLEEQKKGLMQKIFTQQIRFKDSNNNPYSDWEEKTLYEITDVRDGTHDSPKYIASGYPLITSKNLTKDGKLDFSDISYISELDFNEINKRSKVHIGDILFGMIGTIGKPVLIKEDNFAIKNVALIKNNQNNINKYLVHYLQSDNILRQFYVEIAGGTQKFIALGVIRNLIIKLPCLEEQEKIAKVLSKIDELIEEKKALLSDWQQFKKGLLQQMFV